MRELGAWRLDIWVRGVMCHQMMSFWIRENSRKGLKLDLLQHENTTYEALLAIESPSKQFIHPTSPTPAVRQTDNHSTHVRSSCPNPCSGRSHPLERIGWRGISKRWRDDKPPSQSFAPELACLWSSAALSRRYIVCRKCLCMLGANAAPACSIALQMDGGLINWTSAPRGWALGCA